jgi:hypothetical protein
MNKTALLLLCASLAIVIGTPTPASAAGDLARRVTRLEPLAFGDGEENDFKISREVVKLETGKLYMLPLEARGYKEYRWEAPDFFQNIWVHQVFVEDLEIHTRSIDALEFDDQGRIEFWFVPIRPGKFEWYVEGFDTRGMKGSIVVE